MVCGRPLANALAAAGAANRTPRQAYAVIMIGSRKLEPLAQREQDPENSNQDEMEDDDSQKRLRPHMVPTTPNGG